jgi:hypothetical protein
VSYAEVAAAVRLVKALNEGQRLAVHGQVANGSTAIQLLKPFFMGIPTLGEDVTAFAKGLDQLVPSLVDGYTFAHGDCPAASVVVFGVYPKQKPKQHMPSIA